MMEFSKNTPTCEKIIRFLLCEMNKPQSSKTDQGTDTIPKDIPLSLVRRIPKQAVATIGTGMSEKGGFRCPSLVVGIFASHI